MSLDFWSHWLVNYPDKTFVQLILHRIEYGVNIGYNGPSKQVISPNWKSVQTFRPQVLEFINTNLSKARVEGPLEELPPNYRCSPLGAFMKPRSEKVRTIHDLSWPPGDSVNDCIDKDEFSMSYVTVHDALKLVAKYDTPWLAKTDLKSAYLSVAVHPEDRPLLGFSWEDSSGTLLYFQMAALPFGLKSAPKIFNDFATALHHMYIARGASLDSIFYLDDILTICGSKSQCQQSLDIITDTCEKAGFEIQSQKTMGPVRCLEFLGLFIDTILKQLRLSDERLMEIRQELELWRSRTVATKRELLSIIGKLSFCSHVVRDGTKFIRRLIELSKRPRNLYHKVRITPEARADIAWWFHCMSSHNGISFFPKEWDASKAVITLSDASDVALGFVCGSSWSVLQFVGHFQWVASMTIAYRELFAVVICIATFGSRLQGQQVVMFVDNQAICYCLNQGKSRDPKIMSLIRALYYYTTLYHIEYRAVHLSTYDNAIADSLSRLQWERFRSLMPESDFYMTKPVHIMYDF